MLKPAKDIRFFQIKMSFNNYNAVTWY